MPWLSQPECCPWWVRGLVSGGVGMWVRDFPHRFPWLLETLGPPARVGLAKLVLFSRSQYANRILMPT